MTGLRQKAVRLSERCMWRLIGWLRPWGSGEWSFGFVEDEGLTKVLIRHIAALRWVPLPGRDWRRELATVLALFHLVVETHLMPRKALLRVLDQAEEDEARAARALVILRRKRAAVDSEVLRRLVRFESCACWAAEMLASQGGAEQADFLFSQWHDGRLKRPGGLDLLFKLDPDRARPLARDVLTSGTETDLIVDATVALANMKLEEHRAVLEGALSLLVDPIFREVLEHAVQYYMDARRTEACGAAEQDNRKADGAKQETESWKGS